MGLLTQSLNGWWMYRIGGGQYQPKQVPFADLPVGKANCRLIFDRAGYGAAAKRAFLRFEGITYAATVTLNNHELGQMLAYSRYDYEVTDILLDQGNVLDVGIQDIDVVFGPSEGWENYSGIIRDVLVIYTGDNKIEDIVWKTEFTETYGQAFCQVGADLDLRTEAVIAAVTLSDQNQQRIFETEAPA